MAIAIPSVTVLDEKYTRIRGAWRLEE